MTPPAISRRWRRVPVNVLAGFKEPPNQLILDEALSEVTACNCLFAGSARPLRQGLVRASVMQADLLTNNDPNGHLHFAPPPTTLHNSGGGLLGASVEPIHKALHSIWSCLMGQRVVTSQPGVLGLGEGDEGTISALPIACTSRRCSGGRGRGRRRRHC